MKGDIMKNKRISLFAAELTLVCILVGCGPSNREKLNLLEVGMTKERVLEIMGKPYERAAEGNSEWLVYQTGWHLTGDAYGNLVRRPDREWLTPLFIQAGKLAGWGRNFWRTEEKRYDVKIDQTIRQK
jgi:hypothetical protein